MIMDVEILKSVLSGLCAAPEVSIRTPRSIASKAVQIVEEVEKLIKEREIKDAPEVPEF